ncbi:MAG: hypothetical protein HY549_08695, partial [Elusimicrobia bacterium]|nr:hypothetical protein [Elusimicrobiota bacterium]
AAAAAFSVAILASRFFPHPRIIDAATGVPVPGAGLVFPAAHLLLTPFSSLADLLTCSGLSQLGALLAYVVAGFPFIIWLAWGRCRVPWRACCLAAAVYFGAFASFLAWTASTSRPAARLVLEDPELLAFDFHSHSSVSWDGRSHFSPEKNARWHERMGYGAGFLTDHGREAGALMRARAGDYATLVGREMGLEGLHIVLLGSSPSLDPDAYPGPEGLRRFIERSERDHGVLTILALPEYWKKAWDRLDELADWGVDGFEILNAFPKSLDMGVDERRRVIELCRSRGLIMAGASDNHGWGSAACAWNVIRLPGWRGWGSAERERRLLAALKRERFRAVSVLGRDRVETSRGLWVLTDPPKAIWRMLRGWSGFQCLVALSWLWSLTLAAIPIGRQLQAWQRH